jgi:hypothetical protein
VGKFFRRIHFNLRNFGANWAMGTENTVEIAAVRLEGSARIFYQKCTELHTQDESWNTFNEVFRKRYVRLQMARQEKNENPQEFADRFRVLDQRINCQSDDPVAQRVHQENAERMLLACYVAGLNGVPGKQVCYASPVSLEEAIRLAVRFKKPRGRKSSIIASTRATTVERTTTVKTRDTR